MTCAEYLALHSELLDERLDVGDELRCREHSLSCASCARYDRVLRRGLGIVHELPMVTPSPRFLRRFPQGILRAAESNGGEARFAATGTMLALAIAGVIAIAAWSPLLRLPDPAARPEREAAVVTDIDDGRDAARAPAAPSAPPARSTRLGPAPIIRAWYDGPRVSPAFTLTGTRLSPSLSADSPDTLPSRPVRASDQP